MKYLIPIYCALLFITMLIMQYNPMFQIKFFERMVKLDYFLYVLTAIIIFVYRLNLRGSDKEK